jgi:hypothetical protein
MRKFSFKYYIPLLFVIGNLQVYSQVNFVQNPSFEELDTCSVNGFVHPPKYWDTLRAGGGGFPQICSLCGPYFLTVPTTGAASYQVARTGNNYTYLDVWKGAPIGPGYIYERSYIQNEFHDKLVQGHTYCVTFCTSLMNESKYAITEIGAYLDDGSVFTPFFGVSTKSPQIVSPTGFLLTDTLGWLKVQGSFVANGTEKYLTLGNFKTTAATTRSVMPTSPTFTYQRNVSEYYFDDISVIDIDLPAYAGGHKGCFAGDSVYLGRPREVGLDDACTWYKWPNLSLAFDSAKAGIWVKPVGTETYVLRQEICGHVRWDTVYIYPDAVGFQEQLQLEQALRIYPQPSSTFINLQLKQGPAQNTQITLLNNLGQAVLSKEIHLGTQITSLDIHALLSGVYTLQLIQNNNVCVRRKIIVD